ncbi:MAG: serine/threonine protein kinase [Gammaproteobacteria bacterium]|nr:serine/threonine protein kinase [Gammaproteobacteria bacterium]
MSSTANLHRQALAPGYRLHWYRIERVLGQGGFGITYLARDENLNVEVAIKEYLPGELSTRDADSSVQPVSMGHEEAYRWGLERFMSEARTLTLFKHPNIVEVLSVFEDNNTAYMVMAYENGHSLAQILSKRRTLEQDELKAIFLPLMDGLEKVHAAGFIHRDIKPSNIYVRRDGYAVLLDFGSARQAIGGRTQTLTSVLSPGYAPFEQYYSKGDRQGPWTDIYGMGATLYHAVTGRAPLPAVDRSEGLIDSGTDTLPSISQAAGGRYSRAFLAAIDHALAFRPEQRPQSIAEWRTELLEDTRAPAAAVTTAAAITRAAPRAAPSDLPQIRNEDVRSAGAGRSRPATATGGAQRRAGADTGRSGAITTGTAGIGRVARVGTLIVIIAAIAGAVGAFLIIDRGGAPTAALPAPAAVRAPAEPAAAQPPPARETPVPALAAAPTVSTVQAAAVPADRPQVTPAAAPEPPRDREAETRTAAVDSLLAAARAATAAGHLTTPPGANAMESYRAALALEPDHAAARAGLDGIGATLRTAVATALGNGRVDAAAAALADLRRLAPGDAALAGLSADLERASQRAAQDRELRALLAAAQADMDGGRLVSPPGNNALEKYRRIEALRPGTSALKQAYIDIGNHLLRLADEASAAERFEAAYDYLDTAKSILPDREEIDGARRYVDIRKLSYDQKQRRREHFGTD